MELRLFRADVEDRRGENMTTLAGSPARPMGMRFPGGASAMPAQRLCVCDRRRDVRVAGLVRSAMPAQRLCVCDLEVSEPFVGCLRVLCPRRGFVSATWR